MVQERLLVKKQKNLTLSVYCTDGEYLRFISRMRCDRRVVTVDVNALSNDFRGPFYPYWLAGERLSVYFNRILAD